MAPISERMQLRYNAAVLSMSDFLQEDTPGEHLSFENISELKGMLNRCLRKDQWDWFSVFDQFGVPDRVDMRRIVSLLTALRQSITSKQPDATLSIKAKLIEINLLKYLQNYQGKLQQINTDERMGWIYILSTKEQPSILKIGTTCRSVTQRVKEINSATGILFPISARTVYRVSDAFQAEKAIFCLLQPSRIRPDREFFSIDFAQAAKGIEDCLIKKRLLVIQEH